MRNRNVFGKKINHVSFVIILVVLFLGVIGTRLGMLAILETQLSELEREQAVLQGRIDAILIETENRTYHDVLDIIDELPMSFDQIGISDDLSIARGLSEIAFADYNEAIQNDVDNPFTTELPTSVRAVAITISMTVTDASLIPDYLDAIAGLGRIFYIDAVTVDYLDIGAYVTLTVFTFYNDVDL
ncbi:MAG TPA: hypothetical protein DCR44_02485 [Acholeplasmatales bacterium]|nr:MAG: hypothetical protein A2Y16_06990 [Tenericutes bacterium GWF2_57_13]HAQ56260.1 hypothetical protein [Acholeplasmatales bacterium]